MGMLGDPSVIDTVRPVTSFGLHEANIVTRAMSVSPDSTSKFADIEMP